VKKETKINLKGAGKGARAGHPIYISSAK